MYALQFWLHSFIITFFHVVIRLAIKKLLKELFIVFCLIEWIHDKSGDEDGIFFFVQWVACTVTGKPRKKIREE